MYPEVFDALEAGQFKAAFCEKKCVLFEVEPSDRFEELFSWDLINHILSLNTLDETRLRVVKEGRTVPSPFYREDGERKHVDPIKLTDLINQGASIGLNSVQFYSTGVRRIADQLERLLNQKVNVNAYLSFKSGGAFTAHADAHDVLVLQVYGEKAWEIYDEPVAYPLHETKVATRHLGQGRSLMMDFTIKSGQILFVPRGYVHRASVQGGVSVHLTFGINSSMGIDFIDAVRKICLDIDDFRKDISDVAGPEALAQREAEIKTQLHKIIDDLSFEEFLSKRARKRIPHQVFQLGPKQAISGDPMLYPRVRRKEAVKLPPAVNAAVAEQVIARLTESNAMKFSDLCHSFDGEFAEDDVRLTVEQLADSQLVEFFD